MKYNSVIFDLDGVLVDSRNAHKQAFLMALRDQGIHIDPDYHDRFLEGLSTKQKISILLENPNYSVMDQNSLYHQKQYYTRDLLADFCRPNDQITQGLLLLKENHLTLVVCTNAIKETAFTILENMKILDFFKVILSNEDVKLPKPDPEIYIQAMKHISCSPSQTLIIEDSQVGMCAAKESGAHFTLVKSPLDLTSHFFHQIINEQ